MWERRKFYELLQGRDDQWCGSGSGPRDCTYIRCPWEDGWENSGSTICLHQLGRPELLQKISSCLRGPCGRLATRPVIQTVPKCSRPWGEEAESVMGDRRTVMTEWILFWSMLCPLLRTLHRYQMKGSSNSVLQLLLCLGAVGIAPLDRGRFCEAYFCSLN